MTVDFTPDEPPEMVEYKEDFEADFYNMSSFAIDCYVELRKQYELDIIKFNNLRNKKPYWFDYIHEETI